MDWGAVFDAVCRVESLELRKGPQTSFSRLAALFLPGFPIFLVFFKWTAGIARSFFMSQLLRRFLKSERSVFLGCDSARPRGYWHPQGNCWHELALN